MRLQAALFASIFAVNKLFLATTRFCCLLPGDVLCIDMNEQSFLQEQYFQSSAGSTQSQEAAGNIVGNNTYFQKI